MDNPFNTPGTDPVLRLLHQLCEIPSYREARGEPPVGEKALAEAVAVHLRQFPWLTVDVTDLGGGTYNVFACDGPPSEIRLLVAGHLDTVPPSGGGKAAARLEDGRYYNLGAIDAKAGMAATLDAIGRVGPTRGVGYLFYADEEYDFAGIDRFIGSRNEVCPKLALSLCGGYARSVLGCRGCLEMEFSICGTSGHASRQREGVNAIEVMMHVLTGLRQFVAESNAGKKTSFETAFNLAGLHGGSGKDVPDPGAKGPPSVRETANKIADRAWALIDIRPGGPSINGRSVAAEAERLLAQFNEGREHRAAFLTVDVHFDRGGYDSTPESVAPILEAFREVHEGETESFESFGYIDIAEFPSQRGTALVCLGPHGSGRHSVDEFVTVSSLLTYRDGCVTLLNGFKA